MDKKQVLKSGSGVTVYQHCHANMNTHTSTHILPACMCELQISHHYFILFYLLFWNRNKMWSRRLQPDDIQVMKTGIHCLPTCSQVWKELVSDIALEFYSLCISQINLKLNYCEKNLVATRLHKKTQPSPQKAKPKSYIYMRKDTSSEMLLRLKCGT